MVRGADPERPVEEDFQQAGGAWGRTLYSRYLQHPALPSYGETHRAVAGQFRRDKRPFPGGPRNPYPAGSSPETDGGLYTDTGPFARCAVPDRRSPHEGGPRYGGQRPFPRGGGRDSGDRRSPVPVRPCPVAALRQDPHPKKLRPACFTCRTLIFWGIVCLDENILVTLYVYITIII